MKPLPEYFKFRIQLSLTLIIVLMTPAAAQALDWILKGCHQNNLPNVLSIIIELVFLILGILLLLDTLSYIMKKERDL